MTLQRIKQIEADYNVTVLYVTKSGSGLYGTNTPTSDLDYLGIFLPSKDSMYLGRPPKFIKLDTNPSNEANTSDDVDIHLHTVQTYMELLRKGETGAVDIHFSMFRKDTQVYMDPRLNTLVENSAKLISCTPQAFVGYCISQTKKYNIRGERYGELVELREFLEQAQTAKNCPPLDSKIVDMAPYIKQHLTSSCAKYIKYVQAPSPRGHAEKMWTYLEVLGKKFAPTVTLEYLLERLTHMQSQYGNRARNAMDGKDWKSMSHAVRVMLEIEEMLDTGTIVFPLKDANYIKAVKAGKVEVEEVIQLLDTKVNAIDALVETSTLPKAVDTEFMEQFILSLYKD